MQDVTIQRYWSFSFWLRKSMWLGLTAMSTWMVWQFVFLHAQITEDSPLFTNIILRIVGGLLFVYAVWFFASRLFSNWAKDAMVESVFAPMTEDPVVTELPGSREVEFGQNPLITDDSNIKPPPPFGATDDLTSIDGIGESIQGILQAAGIHSLADLATQNVDTLESILSNAGERFRFHNPADWPLQAQSIIDSQWEALS